MAIHKAEFILPIIYVDLQQRVVQIWAKVGKGATIEQVLHDLQLWTHFPELRGMTSPQSSYCCAVFGEKKALYRPLFEGDRLEIVRRLAQTATQKRENRYRLKQEALKN